MSHAVWLLQEYMGSGLIVIWFLIALLYLFVREEKKPVRILFVYVPLVLLFLFFNPLFVKVMGSLLGDEIYYRVLWLLPMTPTLGYVIVKLCVALRGKRRCLLTVGAVGLVVLSGSYIYRNPFFAKADNWYHMPDSVVKICDAIEVPGREVTAVFPLDMVQYVRQYSPVVCMPYGREMLVDTAWNDWAVQDDLCDVMESETVEAERLGQLAKERGCIYIVLPGKKKVKGDLQKAGYALFAEIEGYNVYRDVTFAP
ncbi:MAG: hypothetical protein J6M66_10105 [Lachnospiraceae bacterium]|nr:hypothetical protein [Lachnospiraceae bacterium]